MTSLHRRRSRHIGSIAAAMLVLIFTAPPAAAEHPEIAKRRAAERRAFTDSEIIDGFFKLTLSAGGYAWEFVAVAGGSYSDTGSGTCH